MNASEPNAPANRDNAPHADRNGDTQKKDEVGGIINPVQTEIDSINSDGKPEQKHRGSYERAHLIVLSLTLIAAVAAAVFTGLLWISTTHLVDGADDTARRQLRAYLSIDPIHIQWTEGQPIAVSYRVHNFGLTPASDVQMASRVIAMQFPLPRGLKQKGFIENPEASTAVAFPKKDLFGEAVTDEPLSPEVSATIKDGTKLRLYFIGTVRYKDAFNESHETGTVAAIGGPHLAEALKASATGEIVSSQLFTYTPGYDYAK